MGFSNGMSNFRCCACASAVTSGQVKALEVSVIILESGQPQQTFVNPLTCCEVINSSVISLEMEHGPSKTKTVRVMKWKRHEGVGLLSVCLSATLPLFIMLFLDFLKLPPPLPPSILL